MSEFRKEARLHNQHLIKREHTEYDFKQGLYVIQQFEDSLDRDLKVIAELRDNSTGKISDKKTVERIMQIMEWEE